MEHTGWKPVLLRPPCVWECASPLAFRMRNTFDNFYERKTEKHLEKTADRLAVIPALDIDCVNRGISIRCASGDFYFSQNDLV